MGNGPERIDDSLCAGRMRLSGGTMCIDVHGRPMQSHQWLARLHARFVPGKTLAVLCEARLDWVLSHNRNPADG